MRIKIGREGIFRAGIFLLYAVLTLIGALSHELWFDESQAWVIVRDNDLAGIFEALKSEGHPPLWYMILLPFARLGLSCEVLPLISWFFSVCTAGLILWRAPFGLGLKTAILFSGGFLFFHSVISRVYCLIPFLLTLIAIAYPSRKKHPILFGLLIGLLANTHVCFCGVVGIFGIYLLIELVCGWKSASARENLGRLVGLGVAGIGVLLLVLPLLSSVSLNGSASEIAAAMTFGKALSRLLLSLDDAMYFCVTGSAYSTQFLHPIASVMALGLVLFFVILRRWRKWLIAALVFFAFYLFINSVVWWNNPCRAGVMLFIPVFFLWLAFEEGGEKETVFHFPKTEEPTSEQKNSLLQKIGESPRKFCVGILTAVLLTTIPLGVFYLVSDCVGVFSAAKPLSEYIRENFEPGTVLVSYDDTLSNLSAYLPEYRFYSRSQGRFYTFTKHELGEKAPNEQVEHDLAPYEKIYFISAAGYDPYGDNTDPDAFYSATTDVLFHRNHYYFGISEYRGS